PRRLRTSMRAPPPDRPILSFTSRAPPRATLFPYTTLFRSSGHGIHRRRTPAQPDGARQARADRACGRGRRCGGAGPVVHPRAGRSEEHTSELQSRENLVCRLLLEKKKKKNVNRQAVCGTSA